MQKSPPECYMACRHAVLTSWRQDVKHSNGSSLCLLDAHRDVEMLHDTVRDCRL